MTYHIVRLIFPLLIMIAILILLRKKPEHRGLGIIVSVVISMTAYMLICFCPTENFFVDFDTSAAGSTIIAPGKILTLSKVKAHTGLFIRTAIPAFIQPCFYLHRNRVTSLMIRNVDGAHDEARGFLVNAVRQTDDHYVYGLTNKE